MALFHVWRWQIIPKQFYYNFWPSAKIMASKNRAVITICLRSCHLEHKSRSSWQQPAVGAQEAWEQAKQVRMPPPRTFPACNFLQLTSFLRYLVLEEIFLYEFVWSFFLLTLYWVRNKASIWVTLLVLVSDQATPLDWWKGDGFFVMTQRWKGLSLHSWMAKFVVEIAAIILLGFHIIINDLLGRLKPAILSLKRI